MKNQKAIVREENEKRIMAAAEQIFAQYGFKGATTERISKQAGLPKSNIHYYFKTKADLYQQVLEQILVEWMADAEVFDNTDEPRAVLIQYVESKMRFSRDRPYASKVWANEVLHGAPMVSKFLETTLKSWLEDRSNLISGWIGSGKINDVDPKIFLYMIWSMTQHYADFDHQLEILNHGKPYSDLEFQKVTNQVVQLILASVGLI